MVLHTVLTPSGTPSKPLRRVLGTAFFATLGPLVYFYLEHKQKRVPGGAACLFPGLVFVPDPGGLPR